MFRQIIPRLFLWSVSLCGTLIIGTIGCSDDDDNLIEKVDEPVKINLLATSPENGGTIPATGELRIVFNNSPQSVTVDGRPAVILNNTAIVVLTDLPNVIPGTEKTVIIEWKNPDNSVAGAKTITFTVLKLVADSPQSDDEDVGPPNATTFLVNPAVGATIPSNQQFSLTFDQGVIAATVNGVAATGSGLNWTALPALAEGAATLNIKWTNRDDSTSSKAVGPYIVSDPDTTDEDVGPPSATMVTVDPAAGGTIPSNQQFSLTFDQGVTAATVSGAAATGAGLNWTASPALAQGSATLNVEWTNRDGTTGSQAVGPYTVSDPDVDPPVITSGTVADGAVDVNPALINAGGFRFDFDEAVTGTIKLTDEAGADLNWIATVGAQTATLTAVAGQELANETTFKIEIAVQDRAGNRTITTLTFVTELKE